MMPSFSALTFSLSLLATLYAQQIAEQNADFNHILNKAEQLEALLREYPTIKH
jgi:hypothetical protein